jgi:leucine dehydrogenase
MNAGLDVQTLDAAGASRCVLWRDASVGLMAVLVIDDLTLGPGAGGVRTRAYPSLAAALAEAAGLAQAMTRKCALAGLAAGGAKAVVIDHPGFDRARGFVRLGELVTELGGVFRTAGDLGTTAADLAAMATSCPYVHVQERGLAEAVARGLVGCVAVCAELRGRELAGLRVAVQGCGAIGEAVARALRARGALLTVADLDAGLAARVAAAVDGQRSAPEELLTADVDVVAPCAVGGVITAELAARLRAFAVCGAANNILAGRDAAQVLAARGILHVPDEVASAGGVIEGIGASVMGLADRRPLIDALADTARSLLQKSLATGVLPVILAEQRAREVIAGRRPGHP